MKQCNDCIHYDVCAYHITEETDMTVQECALGFKDKARYIELPVNVGDVVYWTDGGCTRYAQLVEVSRIVYTKRHGIEFGGYTRNQTYRMFYASDIGETVFLTKAEAEQLLAERNKR